MELGQGFPKLMNRKQFRNQFGTSGVVVLPVIHVINAEQACRNVSVAKRAKAHGVFLINHDFSVQKFLPIIREVRKRFPDIWLGINFLAVTGKEAFPILMNSNLGRIDGYWADDGRIIENSTSQPEAEEILATARRVGFGGFYCGGVAFKKQRAVSARAVESAARAGRGLMHAVITSGQKTGSACATWKLARMRRGVGDGPLMVGSGVTPQNFAEQARFVDAILVATGVSTDFYNLDEAKLCDVVQQAGRSPVNQGWYLSLMQPRTRGEDYAWLDPSVIYAHPRGFRAAAEDILAPFERSSIDLVVGIDGMGFNLGSYCAALLGTGFVVIRKFNKLCVDVDVQAYVDYSRTEKKMEIRRGAIPRGAGVLIVDQWIETGGTMLAALELVKRQGGNVVGVGCVCCEQKSLRAQSILKNYVVGTCVLPNTNVQEQCNNQWLEVWGPKAKL